MGQEIEQTLTEIKSDVEKIKEAPLAEHSVLFARINGQLSRKLTEIESS